MKCLGKLRFSAALFLLLPALACGSSPPAIVGSWEATAYVGSVETGVDMSFPLDVSRDGSAILNKASATWSGPNQGRYLLTFENGDTLGVKRVGDALITTNPFGFLKAGTRFVRQGVSSQP